MKRAFVAVVIVVIIIVIAALFLVRSSPPSGGPVGQYTPPGQALLSLDLGVAPQSPEVNQPVTVSGSVTNTGAADATAEVLIDAGDQTTQQLPVSVRARSQESFSITHAYGQEGGYTITATLVANGGNVAVRTSHVAVMQQTQHSDCRLGQCVLISGPGSYLCSADDQCVGANENGTTGTSTGGTGGTGGAGGSVSGSGADPIPSVTGDIAVADVLLAHGEVTETIDIQVNAVLENHGSVALAAIAHASITYDGIFEQAADVWADLAPSGTQNVYLGTKTLPTGSHNVTVTVTIDNFIDTNPENNVRTEPLDIR